MTVSIAVIEPSGRLYGSEFCLLDIVTGLSDDRFNWRVFLPQGQGFDNLLAQHDVPCEFLIPSNLGQLSALRKVLVYGRVLNRLRQLKPDLLYINQTGSLRAGALYARILGLPVVCQVQTLEDARWLSSRPELHRVVYAFICNSSFIADQADVDPHKKCVLYQGMQPERISRTRSNAQLATSSPSSAEFTFGILGRIAISKGHYLLIDAIQKLGDRLPKSRFVVIGEGLTPDDTRAYQNAVSDAGLTDRFVFRGYQTNIQQELSNIDGLLIPSIAEPLGRVLFDAAEFGVPVVISNAGGLGELGQRFHIGVRFESENEEALASAMIDLAENFIDHGQEFAQSSVQMMERLSMKSYLDAVTRILVDGSQRLPSAITWLGDDQ